MEIEITLTKAEISCAVRKYLEDEKGFLMDGDRLTFYSAQGAFVSIDRVKCQVRNIIAKGDDF